MKRTLYIFVAIIMVSCIQNYPNEFKPHVENICECMNYRKQLRRDNIPEEAQYIYDDNDYKECIIDAVIDQIDTKSKEFTAAIKALCPDLTDVQNRHVNEIDI